MFSRKKHLLRTLSVLISLVVCAPSPSRAEPRVRSAAPGAGLRFFVVAHQDDDFLFPGRELYEALGQGPTVVAFVTAGNVEDPNHNGALNASCPDLACRQQRYIEWRMAGSLAAHFEMVEGVQVLMTAAGCEIVTAGATARRLYRCQVGKVTLY